MSWFSDLFKFGKKEATKVEDSQVDMAADKAKGVAPDQVDSGIDTAADKAKDYTGTENPPP